MKKNQFKIRLIYISFLLILIVSSVNAQVVDRTMFKAGIKGGLNLTNMYVDGTTDERPRGGYHFGLFVRGMLSETFAIQPELLYSAKGAEISYKNDFATGSVKIGLNYIELPVLAMATIGNNINIHAGPYISYLINTNITNKTSRDLSDFTEEIDENNFDNFDWGLIGGLEVGFNAVYGGVRYNYGLMEIGKDKEFFTEPSYNFPGAVNRGVQLYIGLGI
jgi:hypothetical protein